MVTLSRRGILQPIKAIEQIQTTQKDIGTKHATAMQEIAQARKDAANQHTEALREIDKAREKAGKQYEEAAQEIKKVRDEARAENILLDANRFAPSLKEKDTQVNQAVALCPDLKLREYRTLGVQMGAAVVGNVDYIKWQSMKAAGYKVESPLFQLPLEDEERTFFIDHAISYLTETELNQANPDAQGLLYLACMYGYRCQYDEMMEVLERMSQISQIIQVMKDEFRVRPMMFILAGACDTDQNKLEKLRTVLNLSPATQTFFDKHAKEHVLKPHPQSSQYIKWVAVRKPEVAEEGGAVIIKITPPYPSNQEKVDAFFTSPDESHPPITIVPRENPVSIEELYRILTVSFILFCPID